MPEVNEFPVSVETRVAQMIDDWRFLMAQEHGHADFCVWNEVDYLAELEITNKKIADLRAAGILPDRTSMSGRELLIESEYQKWLMFEIYKQ